jgi:hypothetical protein
MIYHSGLLQQRFEGMGAGHLPTKGVRPPRAITLDHRTNAIVGSPHQRHRCGAGLHRFTAALKYPHKSRAGVLVKPLIPLPAVVPTPPKEMLIVGHGNPYGHMIYHSGNRN